MKREIEVALKKYVDISVKNDLGYISNDSAKEIELEVNSVYLITVNNTYNVSLVCLVCTGGSMNMCTITKLKDSSYITINALSTTRIKVSTGSANGNIYALKLTT